MYLSCHFIRPSRNVIGRFTIIVNKIRLKFIRNFELKMFWKIKNLQWRFVSILKRIRIDEIKFIWFFWISSYYYMVYFVNQREDRLININFKCAEISADDWSYTVVENMSQYFYFKDIYPYIQKFIVTDFSIARTLFAGCHKDLLPMTFC